jgi:hypothetical protein
MYKKCPKCGFERKPDDSSDGGICPGCGLVFSKWVGRVLGTIPLPRADAQADGGLSGREGSLLVRLTYVEPRTDPVYFWGRVAAYVLFFVWGWYFILLDFRSNEIGQSFMHRINLVFHEAGHIVFMAFGNFMMILGGTLGQLLMPLIVGGALMLKNHDNFGGSIGLWWLGQSLMDCAPYIADARALQLMLLGGGTGQDRPGMHDWENILLDLNLIQHDTKIAAGADAVGTLLMLTAFVWGAYILLRQYRNVQSLD